MAFVKNIDNAGEILIENLSSRAGVDSTARGQGLTLLSRQCAQRSTGVFAIGIAFGFCRGSVPSLCGLFSVSVTVAVQYVCLGALDRAPVCVIQSETASGIGV